MLLLDSTEPGFFRTARNPLAASRSTRRALQIIGSRLQVSKRSPRRTNVQASENSRKKLKAIRSVLSQRHGSADEGGTARVEGDCVPSHAMSATSIPAEKKRLAMRDVGGRDLFDQKSFDFGPKPFKRSDRSQQITSKPLSLLLLELLHSLPSHQNSQPSFRKRSHIS